MAEQLINFKEYYNLVKSQVVERNNFTLNLTPSWVPFRISKKIRKEIYKNILKRLSEWSEKTLVYNLNVNSKPAKRHKDILIKNRGKHMLQTENVDWWNLDDLLYSSCLLSLCSIPVTRGSILFECNSAKIEWQDILKYCFNPMVINNINTVCGKIAMQYAKNHCNEKQLCVVLSNNNSGLESITICADRNNILNIFEKAAHFCNITKTYKECNIDIYKKVLTKQSS